MKDDQIPILMLLHCQLQSVVHTIDRLEYESAYVREVKQATKLYMKRIEPKVIEVGNKIPLTDSDVYVEIVKLMDELAEDIQAKIQIEDDER